MREAVYDPDDETVRRVDWKAAPHDVLEALDGLLSPHGLEVVNYDTGGDEYAFKVERAASATDCKSGTPLSPIPPGKGRDQR